MSANLDLSSEMLVRIVETGCACAVEEMLAEYRGPVLAALQAALSVGRWDLAELLWGHGGAEEDEDQCTRAFFGALPPSGALGSTGCTGRAVYTLWKRVVGERHEEDVLLGAIRGGCLTLSQAFNLLDGVSRQTVFVGKLLKYCFERGDQEAMEVANLLCLLDRVKWTREGNMTAQDLREVATDDRALGLMWSSSLCRQMVQCMVQDDRCRDLLAYVLQRFPHNANCILEACVVSGRNEQVKNCLDAWPGSVEEPGGHPDPNLLYRVLPKTAPPGTAEALLGHERFTLYTDPVWGPSHEANRQYMMRLVLTHGHLGAFKCIEHMFEPEELDRAVFEPCVVHKWQIVAHWVRRRGHRVLTPLPSLGGMSILHRIMAGGRSNELMITLLTDELTDAPDAAEQLRSALAEYNMSVARFMYEICLYAQPVALVRRLMQTGLGEADGAYMSMFARSVDMLRALLDVGVPVDYEIILNALHRENTEMLRLLLLHGTRLLPAQMKYMSKAAARLYDEQVVLPYVLARGRWARAWRLPQSIAQRQPELCGNPDFRLSREQERRAVVEFLCDDLSDDLFIEFLTGFIDGDVATSTHTRAK